MDNQNQQQPDMPIPPVQPGKIPLTSPQATTFLKIEVKVLTGIIIFLLILFGIVVIVNRNMTPVNTLHGQITPTPTTVTSALIRDIDPIATTSAFREMESAYATYSAAINTFIPDDPIVAPPFIDLTLDFQ